MQRIRGNIQYTQMPLQQEEPPVNMRLPEMVPLAYGMKYNACCHLFIQVGYTFWEPVLHWKPSHLPTVCLCERIERGKQESKGLFTIQSVCLKCEERAQTASGDDKSAPGSVFIYFLAHNCITGFLWRGGFAGAGAASALRVSGAITTAPVPRRTLKQAREEHYRRLAVIVSKQWKMFVAEKKRRRQQHYQYQPAGQVLPNASRMPRESSLAIQALRKWRETAEREASLIDLGAAVLHLRAKRLFTQCLGAWHSAAMMHYSLRTHSLGRLVYIDTKECGNVGVEKHSNHGLLRAGSNRPRAIACALSFRS